MVLVIVNTCDYYLVGFLTSAAGEQIELLVFLKQAGNQASEVRAQMARTYSEVSAGFIIVRGRGAQHYPSNPASRHSAH